MENQQIILDKPGLTKSSRSRWLSSLSVAWQNQKIGSCRPMSYWSLPSNTIARQTRSSWSSGARSDASYPDVPSLFI